MEDATKTTDQSQIATEATPPSDGNESDPPHTEPYSLREWMYDILDENGEPFIHAAYTSADKGKFFVLCEKAKAIQVLQMLHNLHNLAAHVFPVEA